MLPEHYEVSLQVHSNAYLRKVWWTHGQEDNAYYHWTGNGKVPYVQPFSQYVVLSNTFDNLLQGNEEVLSELKT